MQKNDLGILIAEHAPTVFRVALARSGNVDTAQDITQQTFLLLIEKKPQFTYREQLVTWLIRAACKLASYEHRKNNTVPLDGVELPSVTDQTAFELLDLLSGLPNKLREVTVLYYVDDMSIEDIGGALGISKSAVKTRLSRARKALEKIYTEELL